MKNLPKEIASNAFTLIRTQLRRNLVKVQQFYGFTLIELLVIVAVIGVVAGIIWFSINPIDKVNSANDSKAQSDLSDIAQAQETYAANHNGRYASSINDLMLSGDMKAAPRAATGYVYLMNILPEDCTSALQNCTAFTLSVNLKSKKYSSARVWHYCSSSGVTESDTVISCP